MATTNIYSKKYLTSLEMLFILSEMAKHDNFVEKEIVKVALVGQYTIKDLDKENFEDCNDIYDYIVKNGIDLRKNIFNYSDLEKLADKEFGLETFIKDFMGTVGEQIKESINKVNVDEVMTKINEYTESKEVLDNKFVEV